MNLLNLNKEKILILILLSAYFISYSQSPAWIDFNQRQNLYPSDKYFSGFSSSENRKGESEFDLLKRLEENAYGELAEKIQVTVESYSTMHTIETTEKFWEEFKQATTSFSKVDIAKPETKSHYDKKHKKGYALTFVTKVDLLTYYEGKIRQKKEKISSTIKLAEEYKAIGDDENAMKTYFSCMPLFREIDEALTIVILIKASETNIAEINEYELKVKKAISELYGSDQLNLEEVCSFMAQGLFSQTGKLNKQVRIRSFTYQDTKMGSPFSRRFVSTFNKELVEEAGYLVTNEINIGKSGNQLSEYLITGTYWNEGANIKIIAILRDFNSNNIIASVDGLLPKTWLSQTNISYLPQNYEDALISMMAFKKGDVAGSGLKLDVWTNKGDDSPIFYENDTLRFLIRVNNECYVRIINHFADGSRVLLVNNMFFGSDKVNKVIKVGDEFQCASPFGIETLQVNAQSEAFQPLTTESKYGYDFIVDDLTTILQNTRGFKPIKNEDLKAEKRIVVTTMEN